VCALLALVFASPAAAGDWWPHPADAQWVYRWTDSSYAQTPTLEKVTVKDQKGSTYTLQWSTAGLDNDDGAVTTACQPDASKDCPGTADFSETNFGVKNTTWSSNPPPASFPVLCARAAGCPNSVASTLYALIWGTRDPVLAEPLLGGLAWTATGGADGSVAGASIYQGTEVVRVPAFPNGVRAAKVRTDVTQAGALGDPYGSGVRTVWWVYGVGPVRVVFEHAGGSGAATMVSELQSTNLVPKTPPSERNYFPYVQGQKQRFRWTNPKHLPKPSVQEVSVDAVDKETARFTVKQLSGPINIAGSYIFSTRLDGVTNIGGFTRAATRVKFPPLGPKSLPASSRRHFFTPFDLMNFGFNPVLPAYPAAGTTWRAQVPSRDFSNFGVTGGSRVVGVQRVVTPAGAFQALVVSSSLTQPGFPFGSGTRTSWFAPGVGLVKLVFRHRDGSVSTVVRLK
jgi:hypothetical protein